MIEFFDKETGAAADNHQDLYFVRGDGSVWRDNCNFYESQCAVIGFDDCCMPCPELTWREVPNVGGKGLRRAGG